MRTHGGAVITSEAKQSIPLALLDCFGAMLLAMTGLTVSRHPRDLVLVIENFPSPIAAIGPIELISTRPRSFWRKLRAMKVIRNLVFIPFGFIIGLTVDGFEQPRHSRSFPVSPATSPTQGTT